MGKNKLILVNPTLSNPFPGFPPLALGYVAALAPDHWDIEIIDEKLDSIANRACERIEKHF